MSAVEVGELREYRKEKKPGLPFGIQWKQHITEAEPWQFIANEGIAQKLT